MMLHLGMIFLHHSCDALIMFYYHYNALMNPHNPAPSFNDHCHVIDGRLKYKKI